MVHRLAAEMSDEFAAVAAVGGQLGCQGRTKAPQSPPASPISVMIVHGPADDAVALDVGKRGHEQTGLGARDTIAQ